MLLRVQVQSPVLEYIKEADQVLRYDLHSLDDHYVAAANSAAAECGDCPLDALKRSSATSSQLTSMSATVAFQECRNRQKILLLLKEKKELRRKLEELGLEQNDATWRGTVARTTSS